MRIWLLITIITLSGCGTGASLLSFQEAPLIVMVYADDGRPVNAAVIRIDGKEVSRTGSEGRRLLPALGRGLHNIEIEKEGFESLEMEYAFLDRTQVLYARLVSLHSLLPAAEEALRRGNLTKAEQIISRCMKLEPENPLLLFLQALIDLRRGRFNSTRTCLHRLRDAGFAGEAVSGLLAEVDRAEGAE